MALQQACHPANPLQGPSTAHDRASPCVGRAVARLRIGSGYLGVVGIHADGLDIALHIRACNTEEDHPARPVGSPAVRHATAHRTSYRMVHPGSIVGRTMAAHGGIVEAAPEAPCTDLSRRVVAHRTGTSESVHSGCGHRMHKSPWTRGAARGILRGAA